MHSQLLHIQQSLAHSILDRWSFRVTRLQLISKHKHVRRGFDSQPYLVASNSDDRYHDRVA